MFVGTKITKFLLSGEVRLSFPAAKDYNGTLPVRFRVANHASLEQIVPNTTLLNMVGPGEFECRPAIFPALLANAQGYLLSFKTSTFIIIVCLYILMICFGFLQKRPDFEVQALL